jgi:hypothetical protein
VTSRMSSERSPAEPIDRSGEEGTRTLNHLLAKQVRSQLRHIPVVVGRKARPRSKTLAHFRDKC